MGGWRGWGVWVPGPVEVQRAGISWRPPRVGRGVSRGSGRGPRSILRARLGPGCSEGRSSVRVGRGGSRDPPPRPEWHPPPRTPGPLPTYAGRHIDEVEQRGRERKEEERGEQRAARQPQQPPADAHAAAGRPLASRAGPAPAAPRPPPPGPTPLPGPRPPPPGPLRPPLPAAASPLPASGRRGPGHMKRAGGLSGPERAQRQRRGGADGAGGGARAGPAPPGTVAKDRRARAAGPTPRSGSRGGAAALRERR